MYGDVIREIRFRQARWRAYDTSDVDALVERLAAAADQREPLAAIIATASLRDAKRGYDRDQVDATLARLRQVGGAPAVSGAARPGAAQPGAPTAAGPAAVSSPPVGAGPPMSGDDIRSAEFREAKRGGYRPNDVDPFLEGLADAADRGEALAPIVDGASFREAKRGGYRTEDVDALLARAAGRSR